MSVPLCHLQAHAAGPQATPAAQPPRPSPPSPPGRTLVQLQHLAGHVEGHGVGVHQANQERQPLQVGWGGVGEERRRWPDGRAAQGAGLHCHRGQAECCAPAAASHQEDPAIALGSSSSNWSLHGAQGREDTQGS